MSDHEKYLSQRGHIVVEMRAPDTAPDVVQWRLCINHTRDHTRPGNTEESELLKAALDRVAVSASTPGLVVGDMNLFPEDVNRVIAGHPGGARYIGGPGQIALA